MNRKMVKMSKKNKTKTHQGSGYYSKTNVTIFRYKFNMYLNANGSPPHR